MSLITYTSLLLQLACVGFIAWRHRGQVSAPLNWLISSAFVTTPIWVYKPLADVGMVFIFDVVTPLLVLRSWTRRGVPLDHKAWPIILLVLVVPLAFAPFSYLFVPPSHVAFHSILLTLLLYRCLLIAAAAAMLVLATGRENPAFIVHLVAYQFLGLFALGFLQYTAGLDLVVYERIKDVENTVDALLGGEQKLLLGFGFLGLFRGAVPQMAVLALFWWMLLRATRPRPPAAPLAFVLLLAMLIVCVAGALSRIGVVAIAVCLSYAALVSRGVKGPLFAYALAGIAFLYSRADLSAQFGSGLSLLVDRFDIDQFTGGSGSGVTRLESAGALFDAISSTALPWLTGLGGYNPLATDRHYGVYGMHGDYLDILARYGVIVGTVFLLALAWLLLRPLRGYFSANGGRRALARATGALVLGFGILAATQGTLLFSGSAGYLACAQSWLALAFVIGAGRRVATPPAPGQSQC